MSGDVGSTWTRAASVASRVLSIAGLIPALACAIGAETDTTTFGGPANSSAPPMTSGMDTDDAGETTLGGAEESDPSTGPIGDDTTGLPPDETTGIGPGDSSDGGPVGGCTNSTSCPGADPIGGVSGDTGSDMIDTSGVDPTWVTFQVSEDDSDVFGSNVSFTAVLNSPVGADFDLYVYRGPSGGATGCGGTMQQSTSSSGPDVVEMTWGEGGGLANMADDGAWVAVEIRAKNDMCAPPAEWTLVVTGNTS